jgi:sugar O-acyltransferase (sialic acid O-acetyltransferase NeuD family)
MRVAIAGAGGMGREALAWLRDARPDVDPIAFFVADAAERPTGADVALEIATAVEELVDLGVGSVVLAIGDNVRRRTVAQQIEEAGLVDLAVVHPTAFLGPGVSVAPGGLVAPGVILTRDIAVGRGTVVNYGARAGHDCALGDYVFIAPGAVLTGAVVVGAGAFVGAGAVVLPSVRIGTAACVGAGAVVTADVPPGVTVIGVPARHHRG